MLRHKIHNDFLYSFRFLIKVLFLMEDPILILMEIPHYGLPASVEDPFDDIWWLKMCETFGMIKFPLL